MVYYKNMGKNPQKVIKNLHFFTSPYKETVLTQHKGPEKINN